MPRVIDPLAHRAWYADACRVNREVARGYLAPLPGVPRNMRIYVRIPRGPRATELERAQAEAMAAVWWRGELAVRMRAYRTAHRRPPIGHAVPRRAKRRRLVAHGWGRIGGPIGAAAIGGGYHHE
jgi:hypothetical protein